MSNINVNRMKTDLEDNKATNRYQPTGTDFRSIAALIAVIAVVLTGIWLVALLVTGVPCLFGSITLCTDFHTILWAYLYIVAGIVTLSTLFAVPFVYQKAKNSAFLNHLGIFIHRDDARNNVSEAYKVAYRMAESEHLRGVDAYSPSIHNSNTVKESDKGNETQQEGGKFSDEIPLSLLDRL